MGFEILWQQFVEDIRQTSLPEYVAVFTGIISVWFQKNENIWVFPIGLINTIVYVYISVKGNLFGEASVNFYYTVINIYGWMLWVKKDIHQNHLLKIQFSNPKQWLQQLLFFTFFYVVIFLILNYLKQSFAPNAIPWADAFASATAYTGMWLMAKKKVESWYWWIATNVASIPLYFVKHYVFTSVYYFILLIMAFFGLMKWMRRGKSVVNSQSVNIV